jgi:tRNA 2-thiouridine synthesizing protein C
LDNNLINKRCLFINRCTPHGSSKAQEALDMAFALAAFEHRVSMVFMDDGVLQLLRDQDTTEINVKHFAPSFRAWEDYGIEHIYVEKESLLARGLLETDLIMPTEMIDTTMLAELIDHHEFILNY